MTQLPPIVLLGSDCLTGLQMARILWRRGVPVIGVADDPGDPYCRSRAVVGSEPAQAWRDDPAGRMRAVGRAFGRRPVAMACSDGFAWWLNEHRAALSDHADFLLPPQDTLRLLSDKSRFYRYALARGLPVPDTRFARNAAELRAAADGMRFPVYLKPPRRTPAWLRATGGRKVLKLENASALERHATALAGVADELIVQSAVPGPDSNMHSLYLCADGAGQVLASVVARKLRQWPPDVGSGSLAVEVREDALRDLGLDLLRDLGYVGLGSLQFKRDAVDGRFYVIEMNAGRPALNLPLCEASGVAMTFSYYCAAAGLALPDDRLVTRPGSKWICWKRDLASAFQHARRGELTPSGWLASVRGHRWSADVQLDDPLPLVAELGDRLGRLARRVARRPARSSRGPRPPFDGFDGDEPCGIRSQS